MSEFKYRFTLKANSKILLNKLDKKEIIESIERKLIYKKMDEITKEKLSRHGGITSEEDFNKIKNRVEIGKEEIGAVKLGGRSIYFSRFRVDEGKFDILINDIVNTEKELKKFKVNKKK